MIVHCETLEDGAGKPEISILVKALNEAENIERCLRSCLSALEGLSGEIIVADSLSDDATVSLASRYPVTVVQLRDRQDRGCGVGAQLAYQHARGRYLYVIDGDMEVPPDFIRKALAVLGREPRVAGVAGQLEETRPEADLARIRRNRRRPAHAGVGSVEALNGGGLYRRAAIDDAGGYLTHPSLHAHEELELALRLKARGWSLVRLRDTSIRHSGHADAAFALLRKRWRSRYAYGSGELLRLSVGKPYFWKVLRKFPFHFIAWGLWLVALASLAMALVSPWNALGALVACILPVLAMMAVKRSVLLGLYSVVAWHVFAAGSVAGAATLRPGSPTRVIASTCVHEVSPDRTGPACATGALPESGAREAAVAVDLPASNEVRGDNPYGARRVRHGLMHFMSGRLYQGTVQVLLVAMYVRYMVIDDYAAYTAFNGLCGLVAGLTILGLERAAMRYYPEARLSGSVDGLKQLVRTLTLVRLAILLFAVVSLAVFSAPLLAALQLGAHGETLWVALLYLLGTSTVRYQRIALQSLMLQRELTLGLVVAITTRLLVVLIVIWHFDTMTVSWGLGAMAISEWLQAALQWRAYRAHVRFLAATLPQAGSTWRPDYGEVRRYAMANGYAGLLRQISGRHALLVIGATYLPASTLAAFGFFQALGERIRPFLPVFLTRALIEPVAMARYLEDRNFVTFNSVMSVALKLNLLVIAPLLAWLAWAATPALGAFTGGKFMESAWVLLVVVLALVSSSHLALLELTANAVGRSELLAKGSALSAAAALAFLLATQPWGGVAALVATGLLGSLAGNLFVVWGIRRAGFMYRTDFGGASRIALNAVGAGLLGSGLAWIIGPKHAVVGSLVALAAIVVGFVTLGLVNRPFSQAEWAILLRLLPRRLQRKFRA